jgi:hypothetical protein
MAAIRAQGDNPTDTKHGRVHTAIHAAGIQPTVPINN